jgi:hypothetical protein
MARFNEILVGRYNRLIQKLFGMKGDAALFQLSTEMMAMLPMFTGNENRYLESWDLFGISMGPTGGAGQQAGTRLRNPAGSNVVVVVHGMIIVAGGTGQNISVFQTQSNVDMTNVSSTTTSRLDARGRSAPTAVPSSSINAGAAPAVQTFFMALLANSPFQLVNDAVQEIPLLPGNTLDAITTSLAANLIVSYLWRERLLEESERT